MKGWQYTSALVIQLRPETNIEADGFAGKVEHISSHAAMHFHCLEELLQFIARVLTAVTQVSTPCPDPKLVERGGKRAFAVMITEYWFSLIPDSFPRVAAERYLNLEKLTASLRLCPALYLTLPPMGG